MTLTDAGKYIEEVTPDWPSCLDFHQRTVAALNIAINRAAQLESERDELRGKLEKAQALLREALPELKESIDAIGDDHSVGVCCCQLISLTDRINSNLTGVSVYIEQDEHE